MEDSFWYFNSVEHTEASQLRSAFQQSNDKPLRKTVTMQVSDFRPYPLHFASSNLMGHYYYVTYLLAHPSWNYQRNWLDKPEAEAWEHPESLFPEKQFLWRVKAFAL